MHVTLALGILALGVATAADAIESCGEAQVNTYTTGRQVAPAVAVDPATGAFVIVWTSDGSAGTDSDDRSILAQRFDPTGTPVGPEFQVNTYTTGRQSSAAAAIGPDGDMLIVWESVGSPGDDGSVLSIQGRGFDATGDPLGQQFQVNSHTTGTQRDPRVSATPTAGFVVVWESDGSGGTDTDSFSVQSRRLAADGTPLGSELQVNTYTTSYQTDPDVTGDAAGGFVVTWVSFGSPDTDTASTSIQARWLDAVGVPTGPDFQVNDYTTSYQDYPRIASDGAGGFVVAWNSNGGAGDDDEYGSIQARRYDASGFPLGTQFQVNTYTTDDQRDAAVAGDGSGGFLIAWESHGGGTTDQQPRSLHARRYDATGVATGAPFQLNEHGTGSQLAPEAAGDGAAGFVVAWQSEVGSGSDAVDSVQALRVHDVTCTVSTTTTSTTSSTSSTTSSTSTSSTATSTVSSTVPPTSTSTVPSSTVSSTTLPPATTTSVSSTSTSQPSTTTPVSSTSTTAVSSSSSTIPSTSTTTATSTSSSTTTVLATSTSTTTTTHPADLLAGHKLKLREVRGSRRPGRAVLVSRDRTLGVGRGPESPDDPALHDGWVRFRSLTGAFDVTVPLPASGWKRTKAGYRHRGSGVRARLRTGKRLVLRVSGPDFPLTGTPPEPVVVVLGLGEHRLCFVFREATVNARRGKLVAANATAPDLCPVAPEPPGS